MDVSFFGIIGMNCVISFKPDKVSLLTLSAIMDTMTINPCTLHFANRKQRTKHKCQCIVTHCLINNPWPLKENNVTDLTPLPPPPLLPEKA